MIRIARSRSSIHLPSPPDNDPTRATLSSRRAAARWRALGIALLLAFVSAPSLGANFTYHGELMDGDAPAEGAYDLRVRSFASANAKAALGEVTELPAVRVIDGRLALELELPENPFGETFVEVAVRKSGTRDPFETLGAPQAVSKVNTGCWALDGNTGISTQSFLGKADPVDNSPLMFRARNSQVAMFLPLGSPGDLGDAPSIVLGSSANDGGYAGSTVSGGGSTLTPTGLACSNCGNVAMARFATIAGGQGNVAQAAHGVVSGGFSNLSSGTYGAVGGGFENEAKDHAAVGGGLYNRSTGAGSATTGGVNNLASGANASVAGGAFNCAGGDYSFAAGRNAIVRYGTEVVDAACAGSSAGPDQDGDQGTFVWADSQGTNFVSSGPNQFLVRATGGVLINTNVLTQSADDFVLRARASGGDADVDLSLVTRSGKINRLFVSDEDSSFFLSATTSGTKFLDTTIGASLSSGGVWTNASSRELKQAFAAVDAQDVLARVVALPISTWEYKGSSEGRHLGPVAEDFKRLFGLAGDGKSIPTVDADGVALAAIQGLNAQLERQNAALKRESAKLQDQVDALLARIARLESRVIE